MAGPACLLQAGAGGNAIGDGSLPDANTIAFNTGAGVLVLQSPGNSILTNSIFS